MGERIWTPQQRSAIDAAGGTLLVSAAAGSGKTAVLVQRVIEKLTSDDPEKYCDADRLLIVTFTRARAAKEGGAGPVGHTHASPDDTCQKSADLHHRLILQQAGAG